MNGSVGIQNSLWHGRFVVRIPAEKQNDFETMQTEFEAMPASYSADTWKRDRGSG